MEAARFRLTCFQAATHMIATVAMCVKQVQERLKQASRSSQVKSSRLRHPLERSVALGSGLHFLFRRGAHLCGARHFSWARARASKHVVKHQCSPDIATIILTTVTNRSSSPTRATCECDEVSAECRIGPLVRDQPDAGPSSACCAMGSAQLPRPEVA
eukprot:scaffold48_cov311-Pinguiococcus_pyrenoidosus.AAC.112